MSRTSPPRLLAFLRRGRQNRSESHLPDVTTGPEQFEHEHGVGFAYLLRSSVLIIGPTLSDAIASIETRI